MQPLDLQKQKKKSYRQQNKHTYIISEAKYTILDEDTNLLG